MATPASLFRPNGPTCLDVGTDAGTDAGSGGGSGIDDIVDRAIDAAEVAVAGPSARPAPLPAVSPLLVDVIEPPVLLAPQGVECAGVQFEARVPPSGQLTVRSDRQTISLHVWDHSPSRCAAPLTDDDKIEV